jgi:hypothetical protein
MEVVALVDDYGAFLLSTDWKLGGVILITLAFNYEVCFFTAI